MFLLKNVFVCCDRCTLSIFKHFRPLNHFLCAINMTVAYMKMVYFCIKWTSVEVQMDTYTAWLVMIGIMHIKTVSSILRNHLIVYFRLNYRFFNLMPPIKMSRTYCLNWYYPATSVQVRQVFDFLFRQKWTIQKPDLDCLPPYTSMLLPSPHHTPYHYYSVFLP